jgi:hypothetical protein
MVKHIVFFKLNDNSEESKREVKERLLTMKGKIKVLKDIEVGINFSNKERAYDIALLTDFESVEALNEYAVDPYHQEIIAFMKERASTSKVVDYKY